MNCQSTLGVSFALDDFGTGYSSLTHLRNLPVGTVKIDQTFIRDILDDPSDLTIVDGVIGLVSSFNRNVLAEDIEQ
jgi:EAL domain-containing protein (putative c-di-GMP-specific phosphodiesterase class I)